MMSILSHVCASDFIWTVDKEVTKTRVPIGVLMRQQYGSIFIILHVDGGYSLGGWFGGVAFNALLYLYR